MTTPSPAQLWNQAGGNSEEYRRLMREHGHVLSPGADGYEDAAKSALPCGWPPRVESALASLDQSPARKAASEPRCDKTDLLRSQCAHCTGREGTPEPSELDPSRFGPWFGARYDGECDGCGSEFQAGDSIRSDGEGGWLCGECGEAS